VVDRRDEILEAVWDQRDGDTGAFDSDVLERADNLCPVVTDLVETAETFVAAYCRDWTSPFVEELISAFGASRDQRLYLLGPSTVVPDTDALGAAHARILARRGADFPVDMLVADKGEAGRMVFDAQLEDHPGWVIELDEYQSESAYHWFVHLFWDMADEEGSEREGALEFRECEERPFDYAEPHTETLHFEDKTSFIDAVQKEDSLEHLHVQTDEVDEVPENSGQLESFALTPELETHEEAALLAMEGVDVWWTDLGVPDLAIGSTTGCIVVSHLDDFGSEKQLRLRLNYDQSRELLSSLRTAGSTPRWRLVAGPTKLGDFDGRVMTFGSEGPDEVSPRDVLELDDIEADEIWKVQETEPQDWPEPPELTLEAEYQWRVVPPMVPESAQKADLVEAWEALEAEVEEILEELQERLNELERESEDIRANYPDWEDDWEWFELERVKLRDTLDELRERNLGDSSAKARDTVNKLESVQKDVRELKEKRDRKVEKAKREREKAQQRKEFEKRQEEKEQRLEEVEEQLRERRRRFETVETELSNIEEAEDSDGDMQVKRGRFEDEYDELERKISELETKKKRLESELDEEFEFDPPEEMYLDGGELEGGSDDNIYIEVYEEQESDEIESSVPEEALPAVGNLMVDDDRRFLVVEKWKDVEEGRREAERLDAKLVASREVRSRKTEKEWEQDGRIRDHDRHR
jgi:hypothetical protein